MGVTGLWTVLQPCARPIRIETLNKKRLAVDASIWIYQFLKAVRDKEGNALRNSHVVGFFRRICKLLFFGIKPVFVFDGGAPVLKRQTISNRKSRREGRREDAVRTAGKLLAIQMQRAAEEEEKRRKEATHRPQDEPQEEIPDNVVYADEVLQSQQERQQNRKFKKKDQYHLPDLGMSMSEMRGENDPRVMSLEELEEYARHFDSGEDINVYDFSKIDFDSPFFVSLPASDRYNILNAARLRSRLRMGYSKDQLDTMFPDRMAFSKFQIERVRERNELTQRLMNLNGMNDDAIFGNSSASRVSSEKSREYVLVKNDGVEGGWALGVVTNKDEGKVNKPIDVDRLPLPDQEEEEWEDEDDFEDVPIEGLNRLPKSKARMTRDMQESREFVSRELSSRRQKLYQSRKEKENSQPKPLRALAVSEDPESLFYAEEREDVEWENVQDEETTKDDLFEEAGDNEEETQLQQAIALSLGQDAQASSSASEEEKEENAPEVFHQERVLDTAPFHRGSGLAIARQANARSGKVAPRSGPFGTSDSEDDDMDLQGALSESRRSMRPPVTKKRSPKPPAGVSSSTPKSTNAPGFDGPLPFEKLNLGNSLLGKKKMEKIEQGSAGGFEKAAEMEDKDAPKPLPPWFVGDRNIREELAEQREVEKQDWEDARKEREQAQFHFQGTPSLRKHHTREVIDVDAEPSQENKDIITIDSDTEERQAENLLAAESKLRMGDLADKVRAEPPAPLSENQPSPPKQDPDVTSDRVVDHTSDEEPIEWSESEPEIEKKNSTPPKEPHTSSPTKKMPSPALVEEPIIPIHQDVEEEPVSIPAGMSPSPEFEDVPIRSAKTSRKAREHSPVGLQGAEDLDMPIVPYDGVANDHAPLDIPVIAHESDDDQYSDPEDAELFASLAAEAEEHARFAHELNANKSALPVDFEQELKQLRAQQKKDRRDADEVTQTMISECQHLLTLFGLPYVTAPMEAEAQCAELVHLGLVDGIVTDDSDTFLFGGTRVYKNMFNAAKYVECYLANDFTTEFNLTREKLIAIAQLLGSDYTTGIPGIGPVTALELLSEFGTLQGFKDWWSAVQEGKVPKEADKSSAFRRRFRRSQSTKLFLPTNFPDPRVAEAYLQPDVDSDPQPFAWGVPDLDALRTYLSSQIGWSWERTDEVLVPVIRDMNRREKEGTQANITRFFDGAVGAGAFAPRVRGNGGGEGMLSGQKRGTAAAGKRLGAALMSLADKEKARNGARDADTGTDVEEDNGRDSVAASAVGKRKRGAKTKQRAPDEHDGDLDEEGNDDTYVEPKKKAKKSTRSKP